MNSSKIKKAIKFIAYCAGAIAVLFVGTSAVSLKKDLPPHIEEVYADPLPFSGDDGGDM